MGPIAVRFVYRRGQVEQALHLDAVARAHVTDVVEIGGRRDHLRASVVVSMVQNLSFIKMRLLGKLLVLRRLRSSVVFTNRKTPSRPRLIVSSAILSTQSRLTFRYVHCITNCANG